MVGPSDESYFRDAGDVPFAPELPLLPSAEQIGEAMVELEESGTVEFLPASEFVASPEPDAEPIVVDADGATATAAEGIAMTYGAGGAGKTTLRLDSSVHFAAGRDWLDGHLRPVRRLRIGWIENEGPREEFRRKIERKLETWASRIEPDSLRVLNRPWSQYDLRRLDHRVQLARVIGEAQLDLLVVGPLHRLGMEGGGTPDDIRAFMGLIEDVQKRAGRPVAFDILHHENRAGQVSGAWEAVPDVLVHVLGQGHGKLRVFWQKARWSSLLHGTGLNLTWAEGEGFTVEEKPETSDEAIGERILAAISADPGTGWTRVEEQTPGVGAPRRRVVRDQLLRDGTIVNVVKDKSGAEVILDHCPERRPARLFPGDDPTIRHLRPERDAAGTQTASARGEGASASLRPASRPIGTQEVGTQTFTPQNSLDEDEVERLADAAREAQRDDDADAGESGT